MKTKINDSDPRLTAYALGELPLHEADEVAKLLQADAALQAEVDSIHEVSQMLGVGLGAETSYKLKPEQRAKVYQSGKISTLSVVPSGEKKQWLRPLVVVAGAAAVVTLSFMVLKNTSADGGYGSSDFAEMSDENPRLQANNTAWVPSSNDAGDQVGPVVNIGEAPNEVGVLENDTSEKAIAAKNGWEFRAENAMTRIPLSAANHSWGWIQDWSENGGDTPLNSKLVRVEEVLNHFGFSDPADMMVDKVQAGVSLVQCPWHANHQIAVVLVKNTGQEPSNIAKVEAGLTFSENVAQYKLLGHKKAKGAAYRKYAPAVTELAPGQSHVVIYEIALKDDFKSDSDLGSDLVSLSVRSISEVENTSGESESLMAEKSLNVQFSNVTWELAPQDTQFAIILAAWAQGITENVKTDLPAMIEKFESLNVVTEEQFDALEVLKKSF